MACLGGKRHQALWVSSHGRCWCFSTDFVSAWICSSLNMAHRLEALADCLMVQLLCGLQALLIARARCPRAVTQVLTCRAAPDALQRCFINPCAAKQALAECESFVQSIDRQAFQRPERLEHAVESFIKVWELANVMFRIQLCSVAETEIIAIMRPAEDLVDNVRACKELACSQRGKISWMFWPIRSQRQLPHQTPRALPRRPLMPPAQGQNVFSSIVFCLQVLKELKLMQGI